MVRRLPCAVFPAAVVFFSAAAPAVAQPASSTAEPRVGASEPALILSAAASPLGLDDWRRSDGPALVAAMQARLKRFLFLEGEVTRWSAFDHFRLPPGVNPFPGLPSEEYRTRKVWTAGANLLLRAGTSRVTGFFGGGLGVRFARENWPPVLICRPGSGGPATCSLDEPGDSTSTSLTPQYLFGGEFWVTPRLAAYGAARFAYGSDLRRETGGIAPLAGLRVAVRTTDVVEARPRLSDPNSAQGKDVRVTVKDGTTHRGKLVAFSASDVKLRSRSVPLADLREVEKVSHAVRNATLISLLAAIPTFLTLGPAFDAGPSDAFVMTATGIAGGITAGAVIGGVRKPGDVIYRAPGASASISVRPILAP
jgi:hypothetical protein